MSALTQKFLKHIRAFNEEPRKTDAASDAAFAFTTVFAVVASEAAAEAVAAAPERAALTNH